MSDENTEIVEGGGGADTPSEWDGTFDTLSTQPWYTGIPEKARPHFQSWHEATSERDFYKKIADGDPDKSAYMAEREADKTRLADLERQLAEAGQSKKDLEELRAKITEEKVMQEFAEVRKTYPDIVDHENPKVFDAFMDLLEAGKSQAVAARMVRAEFEIAPAPAPSASAAQPSGNTSASAPTKTREVVLPKSEQAMSDTSNTPRPEKGGKYKGMGWEEAKAAKLRDMEAEESDE